MEEEGEMENGRIKGAEDREKGRDRKEGGRWKAGVEK
jgi:hypothetical protein